MTLHSRTFVYAPQACTSKARRYPASPQSDAVLAFVRAEVDAGRPFPHPRAIAAHMGWKNARSALDTLERLARNGLVVAKQVRNRMRRGRVWELAP